MFEAARVYLSDFQSKFQKTKMQQPKGTIKWRPPRVGMYKTNYDDAIFVESEEAGIRVIIRDVKGLVIAALAEKIPYMGSMEVLEALAARRVARFAVELGLIEYKFEGGLEGFKVSEWGSFIHWGDYQKHDVYYRFASNFFFLSY